MSMTSAQMQAMLNTLQTELGRKMDAAQAATDLKLDNLMGLHDGLSGEMKTMEAKFDQKVAEINMSLGELRSQVNASRAASSRAASSDGSTLGFTRMAGGDGKLRRGEARPSDPCKRFIGTFPRTLLGKEIEMHWNTKIVPNLPREVIEGCNTKFSGSAKSYQLIFTNELLAKRFQDLISEVDIDWVDRRTRVSHNIRSRADLPLVVRAKQRAASVIYGKTLELLKAGPHGDVMTHCRLGVNGYQGLINLYTDDEVWELFTIRGNEQCGYSFDPNTTNLENWGVSRDK
ncbi:unnamed protein product, partial [Prorocentrum cordatum]